MDCSARLAIGLLTRKEISDNKACAPTSNSTIPPHEAITPVERAGLRLSLFLTVVLLAGFSPSTLRAEADGHPGLERDVLPLLKARCVKCHGPIKPKGKLNLSSARHWREGERTVQ